MKKESTEKFMSLKSLLAVTLAVFLLVAALPVRVHAASFTKSAPKLMYSGCSSLYNGVQLQWSGVRGAKSYQVYRASAKNGIYRKIATTKYTKILLKPKVSNGDYYYKVRAANGRSTSRWSQKIRIFAQSAQILSMNNSKYSGYTSFIVKVNNRTGKKMYFNGGRNSNYSLYMVNPSTKKRIAGRPGNSRLNCRAGKAKVIPARKSATIEILYPTNLVTNELRNDYHYFLITASFYPNGKGSSFAIGCTNWLTESGGAGRIAK